MKRFTTLFAIILTILFFSVPSFAGNSNGSFSPGVIQNHNQATGGAGGNATITNSGNATIHKGAVQVKNKNTNVNLNANINKNKNVNKNTNINVNANKNVNKNKNINKNTNIQGQMQGQIQGQAQKQNQGQDQSQSTENSNNSTQDVVFNQTIEAAETKRDHHTGTAVTFGSLGSYSESKYAGSNFQTAEMLTMFKDTFSYEAALEVYGKQYGKGYCETVGKSYNGRHLDDPSKEIKVYTMDDKIDPSTIKSIGFLTVKGVKGKGATSFVVLQKAILSACIMKGHAILVTKQGAETITKTSGWGIGFNTSGSMINDMDNRGRSGAASGGTGYSSGSGSLEILPWMTVQVLQYK